MWHWGEEQKRAVTAAYTALLSHTYAGARFNVYTTAYSSIAGVKSEPGAVAKGLAGRSFVEPSSPVLFKFFIRLFTIFAHPSRVTGHSRSRF